MRIVAIKEMSAGNDTVGEMWQETKIFNDLQPISAIMKWVGLRKQVTLSIPENDYKEFETY